MPYLPFNVASFDIFEQLVGVTSDQYIAFLDLRLGVAAITFETDEKFIKYIKIKNYLKRVQISSFWSSFCYRFFSL